VTVAVIKPQDKKFELKESDLRIEWFSGTGGGGQYRNKHQNSCRLIHIPTGTVETAQCRSRENSYKEARTNLAQKLERATQNKAHAETAAVRKEMVGSGMRGDKIRTYRFQDDSVTDHNSGKSAQVAKVMKGNFDLLW
jgi:peptide chain release factor 1